MVTSFIVLTACALQAQRAAAASWSLQSFATPPIGAASQLDSVSCTSATWCMAVGRNSTKQRTLAEVWNGTSWKIVSSPNPNSVNDELLGVSCTSPTSCVAAGFDGKSIYSDVPLATVWNGTVWSPAQAIPVPTGTSTSQLNAVSCGGTTCEAVGSYTDSSGGTHTLAEIWNGSAWSQQTTPTPPSVGGALTAISCASQTACMAIGSSPSGNTQTIAETWDGAGWTAVSVPSSLSLNGISCLGANACTAVGSTYDTSTATTIPVAASWDGSTWTATDLPNPSGYFYLGVSLTSVSCLSASACVAVGNYESTPTIWHAVAETWNGSTWSIQPATEPHGSLGGLLYGLSCWAAAACITTGGYTNAIGDGATWADVFNGSSWTPQNSPNPIVPSYAVQLFDVSCIGSSWCSLVGGYANGGNGGSSLAEMWNGTKWAVTRTPNPGLQYGSTLDAMWCGSSTSCMAVGTYRNSNYLTQLFAARWNGTGWTRLTMPTPAATYLGLDAVSCSSITACVAVGWQEGSGAHNVPLSEVWNGTSWMIASTPAPSGTGDDNLTGVSCPSPTACTAVGYYADSSGMSEILSEAWNGSAWSVQSPATPAGAISPAFSGVSCLSPADCIAVGQYSLSSSGDTLAEVWDSTSWTIQNTPNATLPSRLSDDSCPASTACEAVGSTYNHTTGEYAPLAEAWDGSSWALQTTPSPSGAITTQLGRVSCGAASACMAVGSYLAPKQANYQPLLERYF